jgi:hypothetical protein
LIQKLAGTIFPEAEIDKWMHDATDMDLLRRYAGRNSVAAFTFPKIV